MTTVQSAPSTPITSFPHLLTFKPISPLDNPFYTPQSDLSSPAFSDTTETPSKRSERSIKVAYIAERSSADLIRVMDLPGVSISGKKVINTPTTFHTNDHNDRPGMAERTDNPSTLKVKSDKIEPYVSTEEDTAQQQQENVYKIESSPLPTVSSSKPPSSFPIHARNRPSPLGTQIPSRHAMASSSKPLPPIDESFFRWSKTASTIFSERSKFYFDGKRSTGQFSDFIPTTPALPSSTSHKSSPLSSPREPITTIQSARPDLGGAGGSHGHRRESSKSNGTFGSKPRRWSTVHSVTPSASNESQIPDVPIDPFEEEQSQADDENLSTLYRLAPSHPGNLGRHGPLLEPSRSNSHLKRPVSMSSASDSTFSGAVHTLFNPNSTGRSAVSGTLFPSPSLKRPTHKKPESEADITAHLVKASGKNNTRIVPSFKPTLAPAAEIKDLKLQVGGDLSPVKVNISDQPNRKEEPGGPKGGNKMHKRHGSKLDQMLGEGAETARVLMEFERRAIKDSINVEPSTPLPPAPRQKTSPGSPVKSQASNDSPPTAYRLPFADHARSPSQPLARRSASMDSLPSITDSLAQLLPSQSQSQLSYISNRSKPPHAPPTAPFPPLPKQLESKNDLSPHQRAILVKRTRKPEQMLGEPLKEMQIEKHIIEPSNASQTILTDVNNDWPSSPSSDARSRVPEYNRTDVLPRINRLIENENLREVQNQKGLKGKVGRLNLSSNASQAGNPSDLRIYVARETRTQQTGTERDSRESRRTKMADVGPTLPTETHKDEEEDVVMRRSRRMQVAKLHRMLGVPVPMSVINPVSASSIQQLSSTSSPERPSPPERPSLIKSSSHLRQLNRSPSPDQSFISFEDEIPNTSLARKLKNILNDKKSRLNTSPSPKEEKTSFWGNYKPKVTDSFMDFGGSGFIVSDKGHKATKSLGQITSNTSSGKSNLDDIGNGSTVSLGGRPFTEKEKATARRRANKLEQVFGDAPPQDLYLHSPSTSSPPLRTPTSPALKRDIDVHNPAFLSYSQSLNSLLHIADTDLTKFNDLLDAVDETPESPSSPTYASFDKAQGDSKREAHAIRRARQGKLSQFFGESGLDFSNPDHMPPFVSNNKGKKRKEVLEGILREMWEGVQTDLRLGGIAKEEEKKLSELMNALRKRSTMQGYTML